MPKWLILVLIGIGLHPGAVLAADSAAQADVARKALSVETGIIFSISDAIRQNTLGLSEGFPAGVPKSYNWYRGWNPYGMRAPPSGFTAVTGWGQVYQDVTKPTYTNSDARVEVTNARTYVHLRSTGQWILVQDQSTNQIAGGHFVPDFAGNAGHDMNISMSINGIVSFAAPPNGYNDHFWPGGRGTFPDGGVDAVYVQMDMRVTDQNLSLVANVGADWWRDASVPYRDDHGSNPGAGMSNWVTLTTEWRRLAFYSSREVFRASPPPALVGPNREAPQVR